jgi:hypothetical protein
MGSHVKHLMIGLATAATVTLSPAANADPIKIRPVAITASNTAAGSCVWNAVDGDSTTAWNSGNFPSQWIQLDLGRPIALRKLRLQAAQSPGGPVTHHVSVGADPNHLTWVADLTQPTVNNWTNDFDWLSYEGDGNGGFQDMANVRYVRITTDLSPSWVAWREIEIYQGVEYFGYWWDNGYETETKANGANMNMIVIPAVRNPTVTDTNDPNYDLPGSPADVVTALATSKQLGNKMLVDLQGFLFTHVGAPRPDWAAQWAAVRDAINAAQLQATVAAFLLFDEPYESASDDPQNYMASNAAVKGTFTAITNQIRADLSTYQFPSIPISVTLKAEVVNDPKFDASFLSMFDWAGFDAYDTWFSGYSAGLSPCNSTGVMGGMCTTINKLRGALPQANQRMMALVTASVQPNQNCFSDTSAATQYQMINTNINMWLQEVSSDPKYVLVIPFLWEDSPGIIGARNLPHVARALSQMAYATVPRDNRIIPISYFASSSYPDVPSTSPSACSPIAAYPDYPPGAAFDHDSNTTWNSGCYANNYCPYSNPPQKPYNPAVGAYFEGLTHITRIELTTAQDTPGQTGHVLWGLTPNGWQHFDAAQQPGSSPGEFYSSTVGGQQLVWTGSIDISGFQVASNVSPTWIAWNDIQFCAPANPATTPCGSTTIDPLPQCL